MKTTVLHTDRFFGSTAVDRRLFGSFAEHMGRLIYGGLYQPDQKTADAQGFRRDVLDIVREQGISCVRYPGGNFVSAYRWEDTVGDPATRPTVTEPAWKNIETNRFGLNEFMDWTKKAGAEPVMAINLGTRGADAARDLLEYCNFPTGTKFVDLRASHGYKDPHNVKLWCLGNEMDGVWQIGHRSAAEYGSIAVQVGRLMKRLDPTVELVACGSAGASLATFAEWDATVAEMCYDTADYLSVHAYYDNKNKNREDSAVFLAASNALGEQIDNIIATVDYVRAKLKKKNRINLSVDEWNVVYRPHGKVPNVDWTEAPHELEDTYNLEDALLVASLMFQLLRRADRVKIGCQAQLCNVISPIMTSDEKAWRQTTFYPFAALARCAGGAVLPLVSDGEQYDAGKYGMADYIDSLLMQDADGTLHLFLCNRDLADARGIELDLRQYEGYRVLEHSVLCSANERDVNTEENPFNVVPKPIGDAKLDGGVLTATLPACSFSEIRLAKN